MLPQRLHGHSCTRGVVDLQGQAMGCSRTLKGCPPPATASRYSLRPTRPMAMATHTPLRCTAPRTITTCTSSSSSNSSTIRGLLTGHHTTPWAPRLWPAPAAALADLDCPGAHDARWLRAWRTFLATTTARTASTSAPTRGLAVTKAALPYCASTHTCHTCALLVLRRCTWRCATVSRPWKSWRLRLRGSCRTPKVSWTS
mmetsp:Transcript_1527/g.3702  ORF Transcript_1527/g.3702 Transcript_1527/m.3702 type:complete len:200 (+) Transcript_1527:777-1376(+)